MLLKKINRRRKITKTFPTDSIESIIKSDLNLYVYIHNSKEKKKKKKEVGHNKDELKSKG